MSRISGGDTQPELIVRRLIHRMGFRFRLHVKSLPGKPDIVLPRHKKIVFVHGCFWHGHKGCPRSQQPTSHVEFWQSKISGNIARDDRNKAALENSGWQVLTIWSCETNRRDEIATKLMEFLKSGSR